MAWELPLFGVGNLVAAASMASNQFKCMKVTADNTFNICDTSGEVVVGVLQDKPGSGEAGDIMTLGITKVTAGETLAAGNLWGTDANGLAKVIEKTLTGADVGEYVAGMVLEGASANELATVTVGFPTFVVQ